MFMARFGKFRHWISFESSALGRISAGILRRVHRKTIVMFGGDDKVLHTCIFS
ncbi:hypothetical protein D3C81_685190 [compost metagenome]